MTNLKYTQFYPLFVEVMDMLRFVRNEGDARELMTWLNEKTGVPIEQEEVGRDGGKT